MLYLEKKFLFDSTPGEECSRFYQHNLARRLLGLRMSVCLVGMPRRALCRCGPIERGARSFGGARGSVLRFRRNIFARGFLLRRWMILRTWERHCCHTMRLAGRARRSAITNWMGQQALTATGFLLAMDERLNACC